MTVDITQEEMNILNLNGISADEVRDNIQYMRGTGLDDAAIRNQYSDTINQLRPITKVSPNDTANIKKWQDKGGITPFEYAGRKAVEFNGTYNNIDKYANLNLSPEKREKLEQRDIEYAQRVKDMEQREKDRQAESERIKAERKAKNAERDKRVNDGTASFLDRVGSYLDRQAEISARVSANTPVQDPILTMAGIDNTGNKLHEPDKTKQINFLESLGNSFMSGGWIPFVGGFLEKADDKKQREIQEHILKGEPIRQDELNFLNHRLENMKEETVRGYTLGGHIANDFLSSLVRFGGEMAAGGWVLKGLGLTAELGEGASLLQKVGTGAKNMMTTGAVNTILPTSYNDTYAFYQKRLLNKGMELTDKGTWIFKESDEKPAISFLKSLGQTFVMFASEASGELIGIPVKGITGAASKYVGTPISKYLLNNPKLVKFVDNTIPALSKAYEKLNNLPIKGKNIDWLKNSVKYDGFIEELGEEIVEDVMNLTLGTGDDKRTLENYAQAIFKSPDEWAVIAGAVALQGGTLSVASHVLGSYMERNGATDEQILETLNNMTEGEKEQKIQELISENLINVSGYTNEETQKKSELKDAYFNQIKKTGIEDNEALANAELMSEAFAALAKNTGMNLNDVTNEANIVIQNMTDEQAQQQYEADNSAALNGRVVFNESQIIDDELQRLYDDFDAIPEDYSDEEDLNRRVLNMQILQDIKDGNLSEENQQAAQDLITQYEQTNPQLAAALRKVADSFNTDNMTGEINEVEFQKIDRNNIESAFGDTVENIQDTVKADIMNILQDNGIEESEFNFEDIRIFGSYSTGKNKKGSDLDLLVQYSGDMREDDAFNMLNSEQLSIYDAQGKKVKIDINPINTATSGTIDEHLKYLDQLEPKFQKIDTAGAENNQTALARQEWKKKGTESRFFKKWFGNSKVVDNEGNPLVVYHGTENGSFEVFSEQRVEDGFFFTDNIETAKEYAEIAPFLAEDMTDEEKTEASKIYQVYLKIENPYIADMEGEDYRGTAVQGYIDEARELGHDGVIIKNIVDKRYTDSEGSLGTDYIVFNPEQIKSVDNQGTFDENNPNIYYQQKDKRNLLMTHSAKIDLLDNILESGSLVAPSMAITQKGEEQALKNFGDILFVRNPRKVDYQNDNIFDRDIYSPRLPKPSYELKNGRVIDAYEYDNLQRMSDERFEKSFGTSKEKYFKDAKKVLNLGYTPSGNIRTKSYNANTLLEYVKKDKLQGGENFDYGLSSLLAKLSKQQLSKEQLKDTAKKELELSNEKLTEKYEKIKDKYNNFDKKLEEYYIGDGFIFTDQGDIFYAVAKNNKRKLSQYIDTKKLPKELLQEMKDLINEALSLPRSYFEAKPLRKVDLSEFSYAVVEKGLLSDQQKENLKLWGVKPVEYAKGKLNQTLNNLDKQETQIYFQSAYHGTPHRFDEFSLENIGTGEGVQAHGWGLYFAENKEISEEYRETLIEKNWVENTKVNGRKIERVPFFGYVYSDTKKNVSNSNGIILELAISCLRRNDYDVEKTKKYLASGEAANNYWATDIVDFLNKNKIELNENKGQLFEVDIPENDVLLDEDKDLINQPDKVQRAIEKIYADAMKLNNVELANAIGITGREIYRGFSKYFGSDRKASEFLNKYGIKGITYDGQQDGRCYVIFDDKAINVLKTYYQGTDDMNSNINNARGFTYQRKNFDGTEKENLIVLLNKKADKSTLIHEFAHVYLITLNNLAQHNDKAKELLMTVNKWLHYDGVEYTEFQHERFANNFVAYVKSGKAPSYGLKKVFENFRRWLNDMYSNLQAADDVWIDPETEKVFEELLGNITINAQKQEAEQIINKARNNSIRRYSDDVEKLKRKFEKKQLTEYQKRYRDTALAIVHYALSHSRVPEAAKYTNYKQLQMILLATPEYKKKSKGVAKQQEEIGEILAELSDEFSSNDGWTGEWSEFFSDTGIGYHTSEIGGDAELAMQAFDVLVDHIYADANPEDYSGEYRELTEEEQYRTGYELEYILDEYKNADDKTIPLLAYNMWSSGVHPYIEEDIQKKWETETNEIDRYQALNKFEQAKEDLKLYAATLKGHGDYSAQFAEYARAIVKRLDFMTETDKSKLFDKLKEFNSFRDIERNLDDVMDYAQTLADVSDRRYLAEQIDREVRQTIHVWQNGIKKTKYTYPANKLFERLREINKMSSATVQEMYDAYLNEEETPDYSDDSVHDKNYYSLIEQLFVKYKINGIWYNSTEFLQDLLERLQSAKYTAKIARDEIDFERRMQQLNLVDECARVVNSRKEEIDKNPNIKTAANFNAIGANLNNYLEMIFNEGIKKQFSLDYKFAQKDAKTGAEKRAFEDKAKKIFGFSGKFSNTQLYNKFINMTVPEYKILQRYSPDIEQGSFRVTQQMPETGFNATQYTQQIRQDIDFAKEWQPEEIELSRMEILYYYIQAKNPTSYVILTDKDKGQFDKFDFDTMIDTLTPQEKLLGDLMQLSAEKYWNDLNAYHIKKYQVELGKVKNYFPRYTDFSEEKPFQIFNDFAQSTSSGSMQKQRIAGPGSRIKPANALAVLYDHMETANTITIMGEQLDLMNRVLLNKDLIKKVGAVFGSTVALQYQSAVTSMLYKSQSCVKSLSEDFFSSAVNNSVKAAMFAKPTLALKQVISFMNYGKGDEYVTAAEWVKEFSKQTLTPAKWKANIDYMMNIPYLKDRYLSGGSMDALKRQLSSMLFPNISSTDKIPKVGKALKTLTTLGAKLNLLDEYFGKYIAMGDIGAIILGGKPYIEVLKNKGYTEEQAVRIFIETTVNDQQSSIPSTLSNAQRAASKQPFAKMFFNFQNTPWQYYRHCTSAIIRVMQNPDKKNIEKAGKMLFCYGWLFPAVFAMAGSLSPLIAAGGDPDDLLKDLNPINTLSTLLTQHPLFGDMLQTILAGINGEQYNSSNVISTHLKAYNKFLRHMVKQKLTPIDVWNAIAAFGEERTGIPLTTIGSRASGLYDITQGEIPKGLLKYAGYTDYRAKRVLGEE